MGLRIVSLVSKILALGAAGGEEEKRGIKEVSASASLCIRIMMHAMMLTKKT